MPGSNGFHDRFLDLPERPGKPRVEGLTHVIDKGSHLRDIEGMFDVGGAAALETTQIEEIEEVAWEELMPECLWKFRVKDFGPLTVGIDAHGNSLYHDVQAAAQEKLKELFARL